jgi:hypothetical protein
MSTKLDFVVFGPGRSGTTSFLAAFNLHPKVFCASEFLPMTEDHSAFRMPENLLHSRLSERPHRLKSLDTLRNKLAQGPVQFYGNKMPRYYLRLNALRRELPELKFFYIYRSPLEFVHSWDRRSRDDSDRWPEGMRGVYGAIEQMFCLMRLAQMPPGVTMVSYRALFFRDPKLMLRVLKRLGAKPREFDQAMFEAQIFPHKERNFRLDDYYEEFFGKFKFNLVDTYFDKHPISQNDNPHFIRAVSRQFAHVPRPVQFASFVQRLDEAARQYSRTWFQQLRRGIDDRNDPACDWLLTYAARTARQLLGPARRPARESTAAS